ncbi:MAG: ligase-associated DNA damage response endonuclease PdeM [Rhodospirillaceae bacterium]|nr:ligase-associated DNA damage response endonuclease PdeM [Rhodospirillaceae bacterium]
MNIGLATVSFTADPSGALVWPAARTLIVADLHFEKGSSYAAAGRMLPPYDTTATLAHLRAAIARTKAGRVICLGDSFHDTDGPARLADETHRALREIVSAVDWIWVVGNHDPDLPASLGGTVAHDFCEAGLTFRHIADPDAAGAEISGHYHPKATVATRGRRVTRPCFARNGTRIVLPAFGAFTGGLNVRDPALAALLGAEYDVILLGGSKLHRFAARDLD